MLQNGVSHRCACVKLSTKGGVSHHFGGVRTSLKKYRAIWGIAFPFPWMFGFYQGKPPNLPRIFCPCQTHKIPGKDRENTSLSKEFPCLKFTKEIQTSKERKDRAESPKSAQKSLKRVPKRSFGLFLDSLGTLGLPGVGGTRTPFRTLFGLVWGSGPGVFLPYFEDCCVFLSCRGPSLSQQFILSTGHFWRLILNNRKE